jgi:hypothetical protein
LITCYRQKWSSGSWRPVAAIPLADTDSSLAAATTELVEARIWPDKEYRKPMAAASGAVGHDFAARPTSLS